MRFKSACKYNLMKASAYLALILLIVLMIAPQQGANAQETIQKQQYQIAINMGEYGQFPHFELTQPGSTGKGKTIDLTGWDVGGNFSETKMKAIHDSIDYAYRVKFNIIYLRVDWESIEPVERDLVKGAIRKLTEIMDDIERRNRQSKDGHQLRVIIALELDRPPKWFTEKHPASEMIHINPFHEKTGPMGPIRNWSDYTTNLGYGIFSDPDYMKAAKKVISDIVFELREHPALFGWALTSPSSAFFYPGAGKDGVGGFADYSMQTSRKFLELTQIEEGYMPLAKKSHGEPDFRPEWVSWTKFRREIRRKTLDEFGQQIFTNDSKRPHPIFMLFWGMMAYEGDNGYRAQVWADDYYYQVTRDYVNGVLIPFQLSSKTFAYPSGRDDMDSLHQLESSVELAQRHGKVPLLMVEKSWRDPPDNDDVRDLANLAVVMGVDIIWSQRGMSELSPAWSAPEKLAIENTMYLEDFPLPMRRQRSNIAVLDYPFELTKFYCEKDSELDQSLKMLDAFQDAGYHYVTITPEEYAENPEWMKDIVFVAPLAGNMSQYMPGKVLDFFNRLKTEGREYFLLQQNLLDSFIFNKYDDDIVRMGIQNRFGAKGVNRNWLYGNKCFIVANWPYIYIKVSERGNSQNLKLTLDFYGTGENFKGSGMIPFYDAFNDRDFNRGFRLNNLEGDMDYIIPRERSNTFLLVWTPKISDLTKSITSKRNDIDQRHRIASVRKSLPIALVMTIIVVTIGVLFTVQIYHPHVAKKKRRKKRKAPLLGEHEQYFGD